MRCSACGLSLLLLLLFLFDGALMAGAIGIGGGMRRLQSNDDAAATPQLSDVPQAPGAQLTPPPQSPDAIALNATSASLEVLPLSRSASAAPRFHPSASGQPMVVWEPAPSFWPRGLMVLLVCLQGIGAGVWIVVHGVEWMRKPLLAHSRSVQQLLRSVLLWTLLSVLLHTFHYADNIWDPVAYCEPRWLYRAWVATEMEITFAFFTPLTLMGLALAGIVTSFPIYGAGSPMGLVMARALFRCSAMYLAGSALSGGHYAVEPPSAYALQANVAIIGEVVAAAIVFVQAWRVNRIAHSIARPGLYASVDNQERS